MSDRNVEWIAKKGETYMIEFEPKENLDMMETELFGHVFGDTLDDVIITKFWIRGSDEMTNQLEEYIDDIAEQMKHEVRMRFGND